MPYARNLLSNPAFNFAQLYNPSAPFDVNNDEVGPDCWKSAAELTDSSESSSSSSSIYTPNPGLQFTRISALSSGKRMVYFGRYEKTNSEGKFIVYQGLETLLSRGLQNSQVQFQGAFSPSASMRMHMALLRWVGTENVLPSPLVTAWNGVGVNPTFAPNISVIYEGGFDMVASLDYSWLINFTGPNDLNNLIVAIWPDDVFNVGQYLDMWEMGVYCDPPSWIGWVPLNVDEDLARVERFIEKSYDVDSIPGTLSSTGSVGGVQNGTANRKDIRHRVRKPKTPTVTLLSPSDGATGNWYDLSAGNVAVSAVNTGQAGTTVLFASGTDGNAFEGHYLINASL